MTVEAAIGEVETARITVQALLDDRMFTPYADETITASETALDSSGPRSGRCSHRSARTSSGSPSPRWSRTPKRLLRQHASPRGGPIALN